MAVVRDRSKYIEFNLTEEDYFLLVDAASGNSAHEWKRDGTIVPNKAERVRYAWEILGNIYGFYYQSVLPISNSKILALPFERKQND